MQQIVLHNVWPGKMLMVSLKVHIAHLPGIEAMHRGAFRTDALPQRGDQAE